MPLPSFVELAVTQKADGDRYSWGACLAAHAAAQLKDVTAFVGVSPVTGRDCVCCATYTPSYIQG